MTKAAVASGFRFISFFSLLILVSRASADTLTRKVVKVVDGDALYVLDANYKDHKIRLAGIDAPEPCRSSGPS